MRSSSPVGLGGAVVAQRQHDDTMHPTPRVRSWPKRLACSALFVLFPLALGSAAELLRCEDYWCLTVRPSDQPEKTIGPFVLVTSEPYLPTDDVHSLRDLAQTYATLYYTQFEELKRLESLQSNCCPTDIDGNGQVGMSDIVRILSTWGLFCDSSSCETPIPVTGSLE